MQHSRTQVCTKHTVSFWFIRLVLFYQKEFWMRWFVNICRPINGSLSLLERSINPDPAPEGISHYTFTLVPANHAWTISMTLENVLLIYNLLINIHFENIIFMACAMSDCISTWLPPPMKLWECAADVTTWLHPNPSRALAFSSTIKFVLMAALLEYACVHPASILLPSTVERTSATLLSYDK